MVRSLRTLARVHTLAVANIKCHPKLLHSDATARTVVHVVNTQTRIRMWCGGMRAGTGGLVFGVAGCGGQRASRHNFCANKQILGACVRATDAKTAQIAPRSASALLPGPPNGGC